jgi:hypothetical protein
LEVRHRNDTSEVLVELSQRHQDELTVSAHLYLQRLPPKQREVLESAVLAHAVCLHQAPLLVGAAGLVDQHLSFPYVCETLFEGQLDVDAPLRVVQDLAGVVK